MKFRTVFCLLSALALGLVIHVDTAQAARYRPSRRQAPRCESAWRSPACQPSSPGVRQVDGRTLWDLGKQNGQWPRLP